MLIELAPADAYGEDPEQIETISINKLRRAVHPDTLLDAPVNIGGRQGYLSFLAAGRALSITTAMAGKTLKYNFKIGEVVEGKEEKVAVLLSKHDHSDFGVTFDNVTSTSLFHRPCCSIPTCNDEVPSRDRSYDASIVARVSSKSTNLVSSLKKSEYRGKRYLSDPSRLYEGVAWQHSNRLMKFLQHISPLYHQLACRWSSKP